TWSSRSSISGTMVALSSTISPCTVATGSLCVSGVEPLPSCPSLPSPQQYNRCSSVTAHVVYLPARTSLIVLPVGDSPWSTDRGVDWLLVAPLPSRPLPPAPQQYAWLSEATAQ